MNILLDEHQEILKLLLTEKVDFMLVGGYAVIHYGYRRSTDDMDLWLKPNNENKTKLIKALSIGMFDEESLLELSKLNFEKHLVFTLGEEPEKIDFITRLSGVEFDSAQANIVHVSVNDLTLPVIHLDDLILSKLSSGRAKDKADVEELQKLTTVQSSKK